MMAAAAHTPAGPCADLRRLLHAWGVSQEQENFSYRTAGMALTFGVILIACVLILLYQLE